MWITPFMKVIGTLNVIKNEEKVNNKNGILYTK